MQNRAPRFSLRRPLDVHTKNVPVEPVDHIVRVPRVDDVDVAAIHDAGRPPAAAPPAFDSIQLSEAGSFHAWAGEAGAQQRAAAEASAAAHAAADQSLGALVQDLLRRDIEELGMYIT